MFPVVHGSRVAKGSPPVLTLLFSCQVLLYIQKLTISFQVCSAILFDASGAALCASLMNE